MQVGIAPLYVLVFLCLFQVGVHVFKQHLPGCLGHTLFLDKAVQPIPEGSWSTLKPEKGLNFGNLSTSVHLAYSPGSGSQIRCP